MMIQQSRIRRRQAAVLTLVAVATLALTGCGNGSDQKDDGASKPKSSPSVTETKKTSDGKPSVESDPEHTLAEVKGEKNVVVAITEAVRDTGGFVTVKGKITNNGDTSFTGASFWKGSEQELNNSGSSVAGAALVDKAAKKRYYVLRDTEGRCLCTMKLISIDAHETVPFFAQFPAPPPATTQVEFQLPTMPPAQIEISG